MKAIAPILLVCLLYATHAQSQVTLNANGPGNTYSLITAVLAPGANPIEAPDCSHTAFGNHIDEVFDTSLNTNVFRFFIHNTPDDDRCMQQDRQRNEIKTYAPSPNNLKGVAGEIVRYKWKFKLPAGFQSSASFTHLHQLKSVGGSLADMPMYTLTTRKGNPDRIELRYAATDRQVTLTQTPIAPLINTWLDVEETITYGTAGTYAITIKNNSTGAVLMNYSNNNIINWRAGATFVRPKWGIYRSLANVQDLRDETVLYANFSIEELSTLSIEQTPLPQPRLNIYPNPAQNEVTITQVPQGKATVSIYTTDGKLVHTTSQISSGTIKLDTTLLANGTYIFKLNAGAISQHEVLLIAN